MTDQAIVDLVKGVTHRASVIRQLESVSAAKLIIGSAHNIVQFWLWMDQMHQVLVIESMRRSKAIPTFRLFKKGRRRPRLDQMQSSLDRQEIAGRILGKHIFRK